MKLLLLSLCLVLACQALPLEEQKFQLQFVAWMKEHHRTYPTSELVSRYNIFKENVKWTEEHNKENHSYTVGPNVFSDLTTEEYKQRLGFFNPDPEVIGLPFQGEVGAPVPINWVTKGRVSSVKNQGSCGSCYIFSSCGAMESAFSILTSSTPLDLSEQQALDCCRTAGCKGCNGGSMGYVFDWARQGVCVESDYPYKAIQGSCRTGCRAKVKATGYSSPIGEAGLGSALAGRPVTIAVCAGNDVFRNYKSGVLDSSLCKCPMDHAVLAVGFGIDSTSGKSYWLVKNSWGTTWGDKGYVRIKYGSSMCQIGNWNVYPTVAAA